TRANAPIVARLTPTLANHADKVEKVSSSGRPLANPRTRTSRTRLSEYSSSDCRHFHPLLPPSCTTLLYSSQTCGRSASARRTRFWSESCDLCGILTCRLLGREVRFENRSGPRPVCCFRLLLRPAARAEPAAAWRIRRLQTKIRDGSEAPALSLTTAPLPQNAGLLEYPGTRLPGPTPHFRRRERRARPDSRSKRCARVSSREPPFEL